VLTVDATGRVVDFVEKPKAPRAMPGDSRHALVSMGNYLFSRRTLVDALVADARQPTDHDFGKSIIPALVPTARVFAYDFQGNVVPGIKPYEEPGYWRDVGTIEAYWRAHMDLLGETPPFDLDNRRWPIHAARYDGPPARIIGGEFENAQVGEGALVLRATIRNSILGRGVWVNEGAVIEDSIVMDFTSVGKGAHLRRAVVDRYNIIPAGQQIGLDPETDRERHRVDSSGLVVIPRGGRREFLWDTEDP
jgi:glucose-1-phosphate adenylyltransferase